jgi:hypothetical protein
MPLIFQDRLTPGDLSSRPDWLFLFGDNERRLGRGGQAAVCRGHANAVGIATKRTPERSDDACWTDADYDRVIAIIDRNLAPAFDHVRQGGTVVCPAFGLGTGRAELPSRAPRVFAYLRERIILLKRFGQAAPGPSIPRILNKKTDRIPASAYYCGRPGPLGNPFIIGRDGTPDEVCDKFERWLPTQPKLMALVATLEGRDLVCWCEPLRCHCRTIRRHANPKSFRCA